MQNPHDPVHPNLAADLLGVTVDEVYERIRQGDLAVRSVEGRWMVVLDGLVRHEVVNDPPQEPSPPQIDYRDELDQIRAQLQSLEAVVRDVVALQNPTAPAPAVEPPALAQEPVDAPANRRNWQGLVVLGVIVALALAGSLVQSSSAQRSDDLTIVLIFVAGIVTGAIASWLALDRRQTTDQPAPRRPQRISTTPQTSDSDS